MCLDSRLVSWANGVDKTLSAGSAPEAADDLSRPHLSPLALLRAKLCEAVAVHICLDVPAHGNADTNQAALVGV